MVESHKLRNEGPQRLTPEEASAWNDAIAKAPGFDELKRSLSGSFAVGEGAYDSFREGDWSSDGPSTLEEESKHQEEFDKYVEHVQSLSNELQDIDPAQYEHLWRQIKSEVYDTPIGSLPIDSPNLGRYLRISLEIAESSRRSNEQYKNSPSLDRMHAEDFMSDVLQDSLRKLSDDQMKKLFEQNDQEFSTLRPYIHYDIY